MGATPTPGLTADDLKNRYERERLKRLRTAGTYQYREAKGALAGFTSDPFSEAQPRAPFDRAHKLATSGYPLGAVAYFDYIDDWRRRGVFEGLHFS